MVVVQLLGVGSNREAWRLPDSRIEESLHVDLYGSLAEQAEAAGAHGLFFSDGVTTGVADPSSILEPITALSALAARTRHIGLTATVSTTFTPPFTLARQFASLDHLSGGRAGWNIVTSAWGERNYGDEPLPSHDDRYRFAEEYIQVVSALWESWDADAPVFDREGGVKYRKGSVRRTDARTERHAVEGPLNISRSPQGRPVLFQAGSSTDGKAFAARHADAVFTAQPDLDDGREFYADLKARVAAAGRKPDELKILPGLYGVIESSTERAREVAAELDRFDATSDFARKRKAFETAGFGGKDLSHLDPDQPIPAHELPDPETVQGRRSRYELYRRLVLRGEHTLRELVLRNGKSGSGHWGPVGSAEEVAAEIEDRFLREALDGVVIAPQHLGGYRVVFEELLPLLRDRGLFTNDYSGGTYRANLLA
ncbi:LLM class flavin-dependent oxidoreductase [Actinophytocola sediminis]